ncbi:MAG: cbb3-type cytochrome c oxidase subunit 3 [Pseudomonadota bacterium]
MIDFIVKNSPIIGLIFFVTVFCIVVIVVALPKNKKKFQDYSKIPFKDE